MGWDLQELKKSGHQPCKYLDHVQGTNWQEWECPQCHEKYSSCDQAYCPNCIEPMQDRKERLAKLKKRKEETDKLLEYLNGEIELLETLV